MEDCIFCKITAGKVPAQKIFETENVLVFLDAHPDTEGHSLVIPKKHFENVFDIEDGLLQEIIVTGRHLSLQMKKVLGAAGVHLASNNGEHAHQVVPHFHLHVIPRYEGDQFSMYGPRDQKIQPSSEGLAKVAEKLKS